MTEEAAFRGEWADIPELLKTPPATPQEINGFQKGKIGHLGIINLSARTKSPSR